MFGVKSGTDRLESEREIDIGVKSCTDRLERAREREPQGSSQVPTDWRQRFARDLRDLGKSS